MDNVSAWNSKRGAEEGTKGHDLRVVDLSLPIESHMAGIPGPLYKAHPTRCVVLGALSENHLAKIKARGLEIAPNPDIGHHMNSRLE
ncbi:MAG: hypothetical protein IT514_02885, partial [Burkholderiales bacterium]|nr:hypothetical protein [Burkholderiales bacterium]